ncbi:unnamed protein product [Lactuca saligna]|uniref:Uncharacterized protein n=1 Tax=Lactuca saligna TaxID=75948 RepID=A0AA35YRH0_LACSI|nr:unnamed protein product [Lactuca saligna]
MGFLKLTPSSIWASRTTHHEDLFPSSLVSVGATRAAQAVFGYFSFDSGSICEGEENIWPDGARQTETAAPTRVFAVVLDRRRGRSEGTKKQAVTTIYQQKSMGHDKGSSPGVI